MTPEHLRTWRVAHHLSQNQLADHLHVHVLTIKRWEGGHRAAPHYLRLALERLDELIGARVPEEALHR
jgi:DNA-binding transcriptional regulator YiaG